MDDFGAQRSVVAGEPAAGRPKLAISLALLSIVVTLALLYGFVLLIVASMGYSSPGIPFELVEAIYVAAGGLAIALLLVTLRLGWRSRRTKRGVAAMVLTVPTLLGALLLVGWIDWFILWPIFNVTPAN
jgi:hypothetical protein